MTKHSKSHSYTVDLNRLKSFLSILILKISVALQPFQKRMALNQIKVEFQDNELCQSQLGLQLGFAGFLYQCLRIDDDVSAA